MCRILIIMIMAKLRQITTFTDLTKLVFSDLRNGKWEDSFFENDDPNAYPYDWECTLIPMATHFYSLAQVDEEAYWWLLLVLSQIPVCKSEKEDIRKSDVFRLLSDMRTIHSKTILSKCVPHYYAELQEALNKREIDSFKQFLPSINENRLIYDVYRVIFRFDNLRLSFKNTLYYRLEGDALAKLFVLFSLGYFHFSLFYSKNKRTCDGMMSNIFFALLQTKYQKYRDEFCGLILQIGSLWSKSLMMAFLVFEDRMPLSVHSVMHEIFQNQHNRDYFELLKNKFLDCDTDEQRMNLINAKVVFLKPEKFNFIYELFDMVLDKQTPPFSCKVINESSVLNDILNNVDNDIDLKTLIPMEELNKGERAEAELNVYSVLAFLDEQNIDHAVGVDRTVEAVSDESQPPIVETVNQVGQPQTDNDNIPIEDQPKQTAQISSPLETVLTNRDGSKSAGWPLPTDFFEPEYQDHSCPENEFIHGFLSHKDLKVDFSLTPLKSTDENDTRGRQIWLDYINLSESFSVLIDNIAQQGYIKNTDEDKLALAHALTGRRVKKAKRVLWEKPDLTKSTDDAFNGICFLTQKLHGGKYGSIVRVFDGISRDGENRTPCGSYAKNANPKFKVIVESFVNSVKALKVIYIESPKPKAK